jgi:hypothetical protein
VTLSTIFSRDGHSVAVFRSLKLRILSSSQISSLYPTLSRRKVRGLCNELYATAQVTCASSNAKMVLDNELV